MYFWSNRVIFELFLPFWRSSNCVSELVSLSDLGFDPYVEFRIDITNRY